MGDLPKATRPTPVLPNHEESHPLCTGGLHRSLTAREHAFFRDAIPVSTQ